MIGQKSRAEESSNPKERKNRFRLAGTHCPALNGGFLLSLLFWFVRLFEYLFWLARVVTAVLHSSWVWNFGKSADFVLNVPVQIISTFELQNVHAPCWLTLAAVILFSRYRYSFMKAPRNHSILDWGSHIRRSLCCVQSKQESPRRENCAWRYNNAQLQKVS